jgi:hypothetical protein
MSSLFLARFLSRLIRLLSDFMIFFFNNNQACIPSPLFYKHLKCADPEKGKGAVYSSKKPKQHQSRLLLSCLAHQISEL